MSFKNLHVFIFENAQYSLQIETSQKICSANQLTGLIESTMGTYDWNIVANGLSSCLINLTLSFTKLKNGQTYLKNLVVFTPQDF